MMGDDEDDNSMGVGRYPVMPSLVALQQMRNRLQLATLGRKLMKWTMLATGKKMRRLGFRIIKFYVAYREEFQRAFLLLARSRYFFAPLNDFVQTNVSRRSFSRKRKVKFEISELEDDEEGLEKLRLQKVMERDMAAHPELDADEERLMARITVVKHIQMVSGVRLLNFQIFDSNDDPYCHLGISMGGQTITEAKIAWHRLLMKCIRIAELRKNFLLIIAANLSATKKYNVMRKLVIPRIKETIRYINSELDEREREEMFRLKRFKQSKNKAKIAELKEKKEDYFLSGTASSYMLIKGCCQQLDDLDVSEIIGDIPKKKKDQGYCSICANKKGDTLIDEPCKFCLRRNRGETNEICPICAFPEELEDYPYPDSYDYGPMPPPYPFQYPPSDSKCECKTEADEIFKKEFEEFGTFETRFEEIVRITRLLKEDGTIAHEKKVIRTKTERKNVPENETFNAGASNLSRRPSKRDAATCCSKTPSPAVSYHKTTKKEAPRDLSYKKPPKPQEIIKPLVSSLSPPKVCCAPKSTTQGESTTCSPGSNGSPLNVIIDILGLDSKLIDARWRDVATSSAVSDDSDFIFKIELENKTAETQTGPCLTKMSSDSMFNLEIPPAQEENRPMEMIKKNCQFCGKNVEKQGVAKKAQSSSVCGNKDFGDLTRLTKSCPGRKVYDDGMKRLGSDHHVCSKVKSIEQRLDEILSEHSKSEVLSIESYDTTKSKSCACTLSGSALSCCIGKSALATPTKLSSSLSNSKSDCACSFSSSNIKPSIDIGSTIKPPRAVYKDKLDPKFVFLKESTRKLFDIKDIKGRFQVNIALSNQTSIGTSCPYISEKECNYKDKYKKFKSCLDIVNQTWYKDLNIVQSDNQVENVFSPIRSIKSLCAFSDLLENNKKDMRFYSDSELNNCKNIEKKSKI